MKSTIVKKISSKLMCKNVRDAKEGYLYSIIGKAVSLKRGQSNYGEWTCLIGTFEAWNDEINVSSNQAFLPEIASIPLEVAVMDDTAKDISFGIEIWKVLDSESSVGYQYTIKNIIKNEEDNAMKKLRDKFVAQKLLDVPMSEAPQPKVNK